MKIIQEFLGLKSSITRIQKKKIANERIRKGLKYKVPSILELKSRMLNDEQIGFFLENLDHEKMDDKIIEYWDRFISDM